MQGLRLFRFGSCLVMISLFPLPLFLFFVYIDKTSLVACAVTIYLRPTYLEWFLETVLVSLANLIFVQGAGLYLVQIVDILGVLQSLLYFQLLES
ncbi:hypothetical protein BDW67DRAFT_93585 [Aspergillus spinulosporus]